MMCYISDFLPRLCSELDMPQTSIVSSETITKAKRTIKPIRLQFDNERYKWHVIGKIRTKFSSKNIFAKPDLTPKQAEVERELISNITALRTQHPNNTYKIKNGSIVTLSRNNDNV